MKKQHTTIIFPHIPKTGGTTFLGHFRTHFGPAAVLTVGPTSRVARFFRGQTQFEDMSTTELAAFKVIQGHRVGSNVVQRLDEASDIKLMVVLRDPVGLTRSRFNHRTKSRQKRQLDLSESDFIKSETGNTMTRYLRTRFPEFVDDPDAPIPAQAISILCKFDYVLATEAVDRQTPPIMRYFGLPETMVRRRVADMKRDLSLSDAQIMGMSEGDQAAFEYARQDIETDGSSYNALGFDPAAQAQAIDRIRKNRISDDALRALGYAELAQALVKNLEAKAALVRLEAPEPVALKDPELFKRHLLSQWEGTERNLSAAQRELSDEKENRWIRKYKRLAAKERSKVQQAGSA